MERNSYFIFLEALSKSNQQLNLNHTEQLLLDEVAKATDTGAVVRVKDLISLHQIASQATLHKALSNLVTKKLILLKISKHDGRQKDVQLSKLAQQRYAQLSKAIVDATRK